MIFQNSNASCKKKKNFFWSSDKKWVCINHSNINILSKIRIKSLCVLKQVSFNSFMKIKSIFYLLVNWEKQLFAHISWRNICFGCNLVYVFIVPRDCNGVYFLYCGEATWYWKLCKLERGDQVSPKHLVSFFLLCYCDRFVCMGVCIFKQKNCFLISSSVLCQRVNWGMTIPSLWKIKWRWITLSSKYNSSS